MDAKFALSNRELTALKSIHIGFVGSDYCDHETIRLYRGLGLVWTDGKRIKLTEAVMRTSNRLGVTTLPLPVGCTRPRSDSTRKAAMPELRAAGDAGRVLRQLSCEPS